MNLNQAVLNVSDKEFYAVGAATNLYSYSDLSIFQNVNSLDYSLSTFSELGNLYNYFSEQFVFIGKDNRIVGSLDSSAEIKLIEDKINEAMATFYGIRSKVHPNYYFLDSDSESIKISDLFYYDNYDGLEFSISGSTDETVCSYSISGDEINFLRGSKYGHTDIEVVVGVIGKDIEVKTIISMINSQDYDIENFEYGSVSESELNWITDENNGWDNDLTQSYSGSMSLRSGYIDHSMVSDIIINLNLSTESAVTFAYKTDTYYEYYIDEIDGDFLNFYINGINLTTRENRELWGGQNDWRLVSYQLPVGEHELKWQYKKNDWGASENDAVWIDFVVLPGNVSSAAVSEDIIPGNYGLKISPNPFNPETNISFELDEQEHVGLSLYDINGREVMKIIDGYMSQGKHSFSVSPLHLAGGTYFTVLRTKKNTQVQKIVLIK